MLHFVRGYGVFLSIYPRLQREKEKLSLQASRTRGDVCRQSKHWPDADTHTQKLKERERVKGKRGRKDLWRKKKLCILPCAKNGSSFLFGNSTDPTFWTHWAAITNRGKEVESRKYNRIDLRITTTATQLMLRGLIEQKLKKHTDHTGETNKINKLWLSNSARVVVCW